MPFIQVNVNNRLNEEEKEAIKNRLGELIPTIPGKVEKVLMVDISDGHSIYFGGIKREKCAYVDVKMFGTAELAHKQAFTKGIFGILEETLGIKPDEAFVTIGEFANWGTEGNLK